jgi:hypothetical protein
LKPGNELVQDSGLEDFLKAFADFWLAGATGIVVRDRRMSYPPATEPLDAELEIEILAGEGSLWAAGVKRTISRPEELDVWRRLAETFLNQYQHDQAAIVALQRITELELLNEPLDLARAGLTTLTELTGMDAGALYILERSWYLKTWEKARE